MAKNMKRIHKVTIRKMFDESPDTSWMGEYSNTAKTDYAIDRAHDTDCISQTFNHPTAEGSDHLQNAIDYLESEYDRMADAADKQPTMLGSEFNHYRESTISAIQTLEELRDADCNCGNGRLGRNEYRYFNAPIENYKGESPEDIVKYVKQDYARMESLQNGNFCFIGIRAEAEYQTGEVIQELSSGGLWGIESDSGADYLKSVEGDELAQLAVELKGIGFSGRAIAAAFRNVERKEN